MERRRKDSRLHTIRGKLWTMVMLLAAVNCVCGAAVFLLASLVVPESWLPPLLTMIFSTATTITFAYWVSSVVLRPLDKLILLAQSIQRTPGMSVPDTTGSVETDDLLHTISRTSRQMTNFLDLMDEVAAGNTQIALDPLEHSDRLSESFQKLVARVTDSIDAKIELDELKLSVGNITKEIGCLRRGEPVNLRDELEATRPITEALRQLIEWQDAARNVVGTSASDLKTVISDGKGRLDNVIEKNAAVERSVLDAMTKIGDSAAEVDTLFREVSTVIAAMEPHLKKGFATSTPEEKARLRQSVRKQIDSALHKLRDVGEQVNSMKSVTRAFHELAKRSNQTALAAYVTPADAGGSALDELTDEIASLSENASNANTVIAELGDSVVRHMVEANASIQWVVGEYDKISERMFRAESRLDELAHGLAALGGLRLKIDESVNAAEAKTRLLLDALDIGAAGTRRAADEIRTCEATFKMLNEPLEAMRELMTGTKNGNNSGGLPGPYSIPANGNGKYEVISPAVEA